MKKMFSMKKMFFGWTNFKWLCKQLLAMYSNEPSYFSKKRFESSMAFITAMAIIITHVYHDRETITNSEILADATLLFVIAGYTVNQIQKEKKDNVISEKSDSNENTSNKSENFSKDENAI